MKGVNHCINNTQIFVMADRLKALQEEKKTLEASVKALGTEIAECDRRLSDAMARAVCSPRRQQDVRTR